MSETIKELVENEKWLDSEYKNSNYYREYLDKINKSLKVETFRK